LKKKTKGKHLGGTRFPDDFEISGFQKKKFGRGKGRFGRETLKP